MTSERMIMVPDWLVEEAARLIEQAGLSGTGVSMAAPRLRAALARPAAGEPVAVIDVNAIADYVADHWPMKKHSLEEIESGLRSIVLEDTPPAAAHGDEAMRAKLCEAYESGYQDGRKWPDSYSIQADKDKVADSLMAAMRAQAGEGGE